LAIQKPSAADKTNSADYREPHGATRADSRGAGCGFGVFAAATDPATNPRVIAGAGFGERAGAAVADAAASLELSREGDGAGAFVEAGGTAEATGTFLNNITWRARWATFFRRKFWENWR